MTRPLQRNRIIVGDAATMLRQLPDASVDCMVTSPPYFALRDYQVEGQIGLEPHVEEWVQRLRGVMAEVGRVLKPTGGAWLNLGDSYSRQTRRGASSKSLLLGPERLLLALQRDGWIVRNKVVWAKANPMPSSVGDRLSSTWEPLYFLVRSRRYFFDLDAIRRPHRSRRLPSERITPVGKRPEWAGPLAGNNAGLARLQAAGLSGHPLGANPGDVWRVSTGASLGPHHATFPEALVEAPLLASCPERVCRRCSEPWRRAEVVRSLGHLAVVGELRPACACDAAWRPGVVLDPFMGSGTTAVVAEQLGRDWLGIELKPEFVRLAEERIAAARGQPNARAA
jgi:site-specific DNA-methyltransferase (adenine-specific)